MSTILIEQNDKGTDRLEIVCARFGPNFPDYKGEMYPAIYWDGTEEGFAVISAEQAVQLARLLTGTSETV